MNPGAVELVEEEARTIAGLEGAGGAPGATQCGGAPAATGPVGLILDRGCCFDVDDCGDLRCPAAPE